MIKISVSSSNDINFMSVHWLQAIELQSMLHIPTVNEHLIKGHWKNDWAGGGF